MAKKIILYLIGVLLGVFLVNFLFGGRNISCNYFPQDRVKDNLLRKEKIWSEFARCQVHALRIAEPDIDSLLGLSKVLFTESNIRGIDCPEYFFETKGESKLYFVVRNCAEVAFVIYIDTAKTVSVRCP